MNTDATWRNQKGAGEFDYAQRKAFVQDIIARFVGHNFDLLSFDEVVNKLRLQQAVDAGLQDIPLKQIVGSCGRYTDFTRTFLPRQKGTEKERWQRIYLLATSGRGFPPIKVYKIDQLFFVRDGNHRVSVAKALNWRTIQAYVTELPTVFNLKPDIQPDQLLIKEECALFLEETQFHKLRPAADIVFTAAGRYNRLLRQITVCKFLLAKRQKKEVSWPEAVTAWYDNFYEPMIDHIKQSGVMKYFPQRTPDDLLAWMVEHQKQLRIGHQMNRVGIVKHTDDFLDYLNHLTPWTVAKIQVEEKIRRLFNKPNRS